jgi:hypothetical protein
MSTPTIESTRNWIDERRDDTHFMRMMDALSLVPNVYTYKRDCGDWHVEIGYLQKLIIVCKNCSECPKRFGMVDEKIHVEYFFAVLSTFIGCLFARCSIIIVRS